MKLNLVHTLEETTDKDKEKKKTQFIKKSLSAYSTEVLNEDLSSQWNSIANDVFNTESQQ